MPTSTTPALPAQVATQFWACDLRDGRTLAPGLLNDARNVRYTDGLPETRKGVDKPAWANRVSAGSDIVTPYGTPYGAGVFRNPDGQVVWQFIAADGYVFRTRTYNQSVSVPLPAGVKVLSRCTFVQAFNKLFCFRGRYLAPLVMRSLDTGFEDILPLWDASEDYAENDEVAYGPFVDVTSITRTGDTATVVTTAAHGYVTGADITIAGAVETEYNGRVNITVLDEFTFTFQVYGAPASPASGTIQCSNMSWYYRANSGDPAMGESPDTEPTKWTRIYNILPNADTALYTNNRLLVPTAYTPGTTGYNSAAVTYTKVDFIVFTDILDEIHFDFADEGRINQGSADEIVDLAKFTEDVVVVWKGSSWGVLTGVALDLTDLALDMRSREYGLSARGAWAEKGDDIVFVSDRRGFVSIRQSESGKLIGVNVPLSAPIQKLIDRIDWTHSDAIRMVSWNSHLYACVRINLPPLRRDAIASDATYTPPIAPGVFGTYLAHIIPGYTYYYEAGANESTAVVYTTTGQKELVGTGPGTFVADSTSFFVRSTPSAAQGGNVTLQLYTYVPQYAVLVFSSVSANKLGDPQQGWLPVDTGSALNVLEWFKMPLDGVERLFFISTDGWVNLMEESDRGDRIAGYDLQGLAWEEIETRATFVPQGQMLEQLLSPTGAHIAMSTLRPKYTLTARFAGVNKSTALCTEETRSRTTYFRPWDRPAWDSTNVNEDHDAPDREDYSVAIDDAGFQLGNGVQLDRFQEVLHHFRMSGRQGRSVAIELVNTQGRVRLHGVLQNARPGRQRQGIQT